jgi:superfamily II DNA/RNA helicase
MADMLVLLRQIVYGYDLRFEVSKASIVEMPGSEKDISPDLLERHGFQVHDMQSTLARVTAKPWRPHWLEGGRRDPTREAMVEAQRRSFEPVPGDPVLQAWSQHIDEPIDTYLCSAQRDAVRATLEAPPGSTLLVVMPTGSGKSLCAHLPALVDEDGLTVVVVPTVALALDQERALGLGDTAYRSGAHGNASVLRDRIRRREQRIIFASPEAILSGLASAVQEAARSGYLKHLVVDEAHIVEAWGDDFRPAFQEIAGFRMQLLDEAPTPFRTLLLSATVTADTEATLKRLFSEPGPYRRYAAVQLRPEPSYWVNRACSKATRAERVLEAIHHLPRPLILYVTERGDADDWYRRLQEAGYVRIGKMTGATSASKRERLVDAWRARHIDIVVATSAFGMGVDQNDVRSVVHACLPESMDRYYQEVGRTGRDGKASVALLCTAPSDRHTAEAIASKRYISVEKGLPRWKRMFDTSNKIEDDLRSVSLRESPDPTMSSRANIAWNQRTLLLMQRADFVRILGSDVIEGGDGSRNDEWGNETQAGDGAVHSRDMLPQGARTEASSPPAPKVAPSEPEDVVHEERRLVSILDQFHLDEQRWEAHVESTRQEAMAIARRGLDEMNAFLKAETCLSCHLASSYQLPHSRTYRACGGCPACRAKGRAAMAQPLFGPPWPWTGLLQPDALADLGESPLLVFYAPSTNLRDQRRLDRVVQSLVRYGVRLVITSAERGSFGLGDEHVYWSEVFDPFTLPDVPALHVVKPGEEVPSSVLARETPPSWRVHLIPEDAPDPRDPLRVLRQMIKGITLADLGHHLGT